MVERWEVETAWILGTSVADVWDNYQTFLGHVEDRTATPLSGARVNRGGTIERVLGGSSYQGFRVESFEAGPAQAPPEAAPAVWRSAIPVSLVLAGERVFAYTVNVLTGEDEGEGGGSGLTKFESTQSVSIRNGLTRVELETRIHVEEGSASSALRHAIEYAGLTASEWGSGFLYVTNGTILEGTHAGTAVGFEYRLLDQSGSPTDSRDATEIQCTSIIQETGESGINATPGSAPSEIFYEVTTQTAEGIQETTYRAWARGPGAKAWVETKTPSGNFTRTLTINRTSERYYEQIWQVREQDPEQSEPRFEVLVAISGGGVAKEFIPILPSKPDTPAEPVLRTGAMLPYTATIRVRSVIYSDTTPSAEDMRFPPLPTQWVLMVHRSSESLPSRIRLGKDDTQDEWERVAEYVLQAPFLDNTLYDDLKEVITEPGRVSSHLIEGAESEDPNA
jgi:hypothetical protein